MVEEQGVDANIAIGEMLDTFGDHGYHLWDAIFELVDDGWVFRDFGGLKRFVGPASTIKCYENNPLVREALGERGNGRVLVVDGGGTVESFAGVHPRDLTARLDALLA